MSSCDPEEFLSLPPSLIDHIEARVGRLDSVERLGGMSGGHVSRIRGPSRHIIVKRPARAAEAAFYLAVVPSWPPAQRFTPELFDAVHLDGHWWLMLEDIPQPLPRARWGADAELLGALARLHTASLPDIPASFSPYIPTWSVAMTQRALATLPTSDASGIAPLLAELQAASQPLFSPLTSLSGDPNPTNWGVRSDGRLILFDWERFCRGSPALDLAITVPGLGDAEAFGAVTRRYLAAAHRPTAAAGPLAREIAVAKVWSVVEFLAAASAPNARAAASAAWVTERFARWLPALLRDMRLP